MKKGIIIGGIFAAMFCVLPSFAAENDSQEFTYMTGAESVYLTGEVNTSEKADVFWGFYDDGVLIKLEKHSSDEIFENEGVSLPYMPEKLEIKSFVWANNGKLIPLTAREDPEQSGSTVTIDLDLVPYNSDTMYKDREICVYIDENTNTYETYKLSDDFKLFVNNLEIIDISDDIMTKYLCQNRYTTADLIDSDDDGLYDYVSTSCYETAVIDRIEKTGSESKIYFKKYSNYITSSLVIDTENSDVEITITKNGESISLDQINENDILSISYDVTGDFESSSFYNIIVSDTVIEGVILYRDNEGQKIRIEEGIYNTDSIINAEDMDIIVIYKLYLNAFGNVSYFEEIGNNINVGILLSMYVKPGHEFATVEFIDKNGDIVSYECYKSSDENKFYSQIMGFDTYYDGQTITNDDIDNNLQNMFFEYSIIDGNISHRNEYYAEGGDGLQYTKNEKRLGSYSIDDNVTDIICIGDYMKDNILPVNILKPSDLKENVPYSAYVYDKNGDGVYRYCVILSEM